MDNNRRVANAEIDEINMGTEVNRNQTDDVIF